MSRSLLQPPTAVGRRFPRTFAALLVLLSAMLVPALADQPAADRAPEGSSPAAVRFRRVYVPADQIDQWPRGGERYLPIAADEFERLAGSQAAKAGSATGATESPARPPDVEVVRAVYEARLTGDALTDGQATLQIRREEKGAAFLGLDACRLPIQSPQWIADSASSDPAPATPSESKANTAAPQPAIVGVGANEKLALRVDRSGTLHFDWSLVGRRETGGALIFDLGLAPSPSSELRLALPSDLVPSVDQGFITLVAGAAGGRAEPDLANAAGTANAAAKNKDAPRHWDIELGGQTRIVLRLSRHDFFRESRPLTLVRQSLVYDFSTRGMQLSADLKLDVLGDPIQRIALLVDQPLTLVTARYGGTQLPWFETDASGKKLAAAEGPRRVVVELPEALHGTGRVVRLGFVAPLMRRGRLPTIRPADGGLFWQEGSASLLVALPLDLDELALHGCRQTKAEPLPAPSAGDAIGLQYFRPDADVTIGISRRAEGLQVNSGTIVDVRGGTMTGRCSADLTADDGECFKLSADVSPSWIIDAIETIPADSLADWRYSPGTGPAAPLNITLAKSIRPDRPLRVVISGRWRRAPHAEQLRPSDLEMVTFRGMTAARRLVAIRPAAPYRLQFSGADGLHRLDPAQLAASDAALFGAAIADNAAVLVDDEAAKGLVVTMASETAKFSGSVHLDAEVADTSLLEAYRILCKPESAELDRLLVQFSRRRDEPIRWSLGTAEDPARAGKEPSNNETLRNAATSLTPAIAGPESQDDFSARRLSAVQQTALGLAAGGEVWELTFRHPGSKPLEIQAVRSSTLSAETPLSLAKLARASEQQGSIAIWVTGRRIPQINNRRLTQIPIHRTLIDSGSNVADASRTPSEPSRKAAEAPIHAAEASSHPATELAAFQYDPVLEIISAAVDPTASLSISPATERAAAWAWSCRLDSYFSPDGSSQHFACWKIENAGRTRVRFHMPAGTVCHAAWLDDTLATVESSSDELASAGGKSVNPSAANGDPTKSAARQTAAGASVRLELPPGRRFVSVRLQWSASDRPLSVLSSRTSQLPEIDMPVIARQWHVWLPPRFRLNDPGAAGQSAMAAPVTWSERLFGPFGRAAGASPFNPLRGEEWLGMARQMEGDEPGWTQARQMVERLTRRAKAGSSAPPTWADLLAAAQSVAAQPPGSQPLPLLIDASALADIGLSAQTTVRPLPPEATNGWPLAQADLVLLVDPRAVVLTSRSAAAIWTGAWSTADSLLQRAPLGPFPEQLEQSLAHRSERFVPVALWAVPGEKSPWASDPLASDAPPIDHAGWTVYDLDLPEPSRRIGIVDRDMMVLAGCGLFLLAALIAFAKGNISWKQQAIALTSVTAIALLLPGSCAPLGTGLWLGLAGGLALRRLAQWDRPLGAYSRRLLAGASASGSPSIDGSPGATLPSTHIEAADFAVRGGSKSHRDSAAPRSPGGSSVRGRKGPAGPTLGVLLVLGCLAWHDAGAAEPGSKGIAAKQPNSQANNGSTGGGENIPAVLIPTDEQQRPKGNVYLVPERLYRELIRLGDRLPEPSSENWLITGAKYQGGLIRQENAQALDTTDWSATYDLEVMSSPAHIWIPLGDAGANVPAVNLLPDGVRLDGQPVEFQWMNRGAEDRAGETKPVGQQGVRFEVSGVGHHTIELAIRPTPRQQGESTTLDFAILPLAASQLDLSVPAGVPIEVPGALGRSTLDRVHGHLSEQLGPVDHLVVRGWSDPAGGDVKPPVVDIDALYWLKVRPGSVVLEARFNVRVAEGKLTQLRFLEDPRLRRLPLDADSPISEVRTEQGDLHTIFVGLSQPVVDRTSFALSFLLTDTSGIGNLRLPKLEAVGVRAESREVAVSVEPPLEFDPPSSTPAAKPLSPAAFLSAWGLADAKPQLACKLPQGDVAWNLPIHSRQPQIESREQTAIAVDRGRLHQWWLADLTVVGGSVFQIQVPAPPQWNLEQAVLRQEGSPDQAVRWARSPGGGLTMFLPGPAPEHSQLLLRGSMPYTLGVTPLPELRVAGAASANAPSQTVLLFRGPDVELSVLNAAGMREVAKPSLQTAVDQALVDGLLDRAALADLRVAACLSGPAKGGTSPVIRIAANAPHLEGKEMTTVRRVDDAWNAAIDLDVDISGGVLDGLRLDLPPQWSAPTEIVPATPSELIDVPGENYRQLVLRPAEPWTGTVRLHLSGPMITPAGQRVRVPDVRPLGIPQLQRYVLLPTRSGEQNLSWEASGLNFEPLPKRFTAGSPTLDLYRTCEVVAERFEATLKSVDKTIGQPKVRLADIAVTCSEAGNCHGTATFDLDPAGALSCLLELAPNEHLIHVRADGVAAAARPVGENYWSVALGDGKLPQRIEVVFTADPPNETAAMGKLLLSAPVLKDLPVEQTLWSINTMARGAASGGIPTGAGADAAGAAVAGAAPATAIRQDLIRLESISQLLLSAGSAPTAASDDQMASWFASWTNRLLAARGAVDRCRAIDGNTEVTRAALEEIVTINARQSALARRLSIASPLSEHSPPRLDDDAFDLWRQTSAAAAPLSGYYVHGFGPALAIVLPRHRLGESVWRLVSAILGATIVGLLFWLGGRPASWPSPRSVMAGRRAALAAAAGLFWWLEMEPSWLGLMILALSLMALLRARLISRETADSARA